MEKKSRKSVIIGISVLLLITLTLLGLTYAYYRTRIIGNPNNESISVTSKKLEITYTDGNAAVNMEGLIGPGFKYTKQFSVKNTGEAAVSYGVYLENLVNEFKRTSDIKLTLACTSDVTDKTCNGASLDFPRIESLITTNGLNVGETQSYTMTVEYANLSIDQSIDMGKDLSARIQIYDLTKTLTQNTLAYKLVNNATSGTGSTVFRSEPLSIPAQEVTRELGRTVGATMHVGLTDAYYYTYASEVEFNELAGYSLVNPQVDTWENIKSNPQKLANFKYLRRESGVATAPEERTQTIYDMVRVDSISGNSMTYTMLELTPNSESIGIESTLSVTKDDLGLSYYYRGDVDDNYVNFNGMCWRIMRIQGDGSVKLLLASSKGECSSTTLTGHAIDAFVGTLHYGYDVVGSSKVLNYASGSANSESSMRTKLNEWFTDKNFDTSYLKQGNWCLGNVTDAYDFSTPYDLLTQKPSELRASNTAFYYEGMIRLYRQYPEKATLACGNGLKLNEDYVGAVTADELTFAGEKHGFYSLSYISDDIINGISSEDRWFTLTPTQYSSKEDRVEIFANETNKAAPSLSASTVSRTATNYARPVIVLSSNVLYSGGNGTINSPYTVTK